MQAEQRPAGSEDSEDFLIPRALPNARFVQDLDQDIRRAARQQMERTGIRPSVPFEEMVIELRKLVRLLRRTLVPVQPRAEYVRALGQRLETQSVVVTTVQQTQRRWLMVSGMVGSLLSVAGLLAAVLLRRRNGHNHNRAQAKKSVGIV